MRCLPSHQLKFTKGRCLHDWHAETVAIRAFNLYLLEECMNLASNQQHGSEYVERTRQEPFLGQMRPAFSIMDDVSIHMYCSEAPCGDASMELIMSTQEDAIPWFSSGRDSTGPLYGRGHFDKLGVVRRKPSRADAPATLSKSCSDKLALRQCTSLLSSLTSLLVYPKNAYLHDLIVPQSQYVSSAFERAFSARGRMAPLAYHSDPVNSWTAGYDFVPFRYETTGKQFEYAKNSNSADESAGSNLSVTWTPSKQETLIGGILQGHKQFAERGASDISRLRMWQRAAYVVEQEENRELVTVLQAESYGALKSSSVLSARSSVKHDVRSLALMGWVRNEGNDKFKMHEAS